MNRDVRIPDIPTIRMDHTVRLPDVPTIRMNPDVQIPDVTYLGGARSSNTRRNHDVLTAADTPAEGDELNNKTPTIYVLPSLESIIQNKYDCYWNASTDV